MLSRDGLTIHVKIADVNEKGKKSEDLVITTCINMASAGELVLKRIMDICGGLAGCVLTESRGTSHLYQISGTDFLLTVPYGKERKKIQDLQIPQHVHGCGRT